MKVIHRVVLTSGRALLVEEDPTTPSLHIGDECPGVQGEIDMYICEILPGGVLVMPNSGYATEYLTNNLRTNNGELPSAGGETQSKSNTDSLT